MSVDYRIIIHRKKDDKVIAEFFANQLKVIFDCPRYAKLINCGEYDHNKKRFLVSDLENIDTQASDKIKNLYSEITQKKLMITLAQSKSIKDDIEEDIVQLNREIEELDLIKSNVNFLIGSICCLTEYQIKDELEAYIYNAKDLNIEDDNMNYVFSYDVECEVAADF